ncbi:hypothetical protein CBW54_09410 [Yersinia kristensenii]|nr:hypothetical protein CBW54_09410 [Yersinia kristensenii]
MLMNFYLLSSLILLLSIMSCLISIEIMRLYVPSKLKSVYFFMLFNGVTVDVDAAFFPKEKSNGDDTPPKKTLTKEEETQFIEAFVSQLIAALTPSVKTLKIASHVISRDRRKELVKALKNHGAEIIVEQQRETPIKEIVQLNCIYGGLPFKNPFSRQKRANGFKVRRYGSLIIAKSPRYVNRS